MTAKRIPFSRPYPLDPSELSDGFSKIIDTRWYTKGENVKDLGGNEVILGR